MRSLKLYPVLSRMDSHCHEGGITERREKRLEDMFGTIDMASPLIVLSPYTSTRAMPNLDPFPQLAAGKSPGCGQQSGSTYSSGKEAPSDAGVHVGAGNFGVR